MGLTSYITELAKSHSKIKNLDLRFPRSMVYNIFKKTREKKFSKAIALGEKFRLKNKNLILNLTPNE